MIVTMLFLATGLTVIIDLAALTMLWLMNMNMLKEIKRHLTNEEEEKEIKKTMEKIEIL